jgi:hypothetical protein
LQFFLFLVLEHLLALLLNPGGALAFAVRPLVPLLLIFRTLAFSQRPCLPLCLCCPKGTQYSKAHLGFYLRATVAVRATGQQEKDAHRATGNT